LGMSRRSSRGRGKKISPAETLMFSPIEMLELDSPRFPHSAVFSATRRRRASAPLRRDHDFVVALRATASCWSAECTGGTRAGGRALLALRHSPIANNHLKILLFQKFARAPLKTEILILIDFRRAPLRGAGITGAGRDVRRAPIHVAHWRIWL
jgi:hypothetical protein